MTQHMTAAHTMPLTLVKRGCNLPAVESSRGVDGRSARWMGHSGTERGRFLRIPEGVNRMKKLLVVLGMVSLVGCGGGGSSSPSPVPAPTPAPPAAAITATGNGALVLHPSVNRTFAIAMETPVRIRETAGGTADWNFARMAFFRRGVEIERVEVGADGIRTAGATRIAPNANSTYNLVFRFNSDDFDRIDITLGFADVNTGRQFTSTIDFNSFTAVNVSLTPLFRALRRSGSPL